MSAVIAQNIRLGVVNFLNASPMTEGVQAVEGIDVVAKVPSELVGCLERGEVDVALASSIDYQQSSMNLGILPVGVLSSDGESMTVQLCSRVPFQECREVHCDSDSHTSIALLQIILKEQFGNTPSIVSTDIRSMNRCSSSWPEAVLIIGDKVISSGFGEEYPYTLDLGQAWKKQTGLPFVFAAWFGSVDFSECLLQKVTMLLQRQLACNKHRIEQIVSVHARERGWDAHLAEQYLTSHMQYDWSDAHKESLDLFYSLAKTCGILKEVRPLRILES